MQNTDATLNSKAKTQRFKRRQKVDQLSDVHYVATNTHSFHNEPQLHIAEDNEAVIRMIIKGRSPTMRDVSKNHRVIWMPMKEKKSQDQPSNWCSSTQMQKSDIFKRVDKRVLLK